MDLGQRIHQFIRVVDGFTFAKGNKEFRKKASLFVGNTSNRILRQLYSIRSNAEHFNWPDLRLRRLKRRAALERAHRLSHQAEALARHCIGRLIEGPHLWKHFRFDGSIKSFWALPRRELRSMWGTTLDLEAVVSSLNPRFIPDEDM
jgi:hypothetical protein